VIPGSTSAVNTEVNADVPSIFSCLILPQHAVIYEAFGLAPPVRRSEAATVRSRPTIDHLIPRDAEGQAGGKQLRAEDDPLSVPGLSSAK
jgi:hypothetical protein